MPMIDIYKLLICRATKLRFFVLTYMVFYSYVKTTYVLKIQNYSFLESYKVSKSYKCLKGIFSNS